LIRKIGVSFDLFPENWFDPIDKYIFSIQFIGFVNKIYIKRKEFMYEVM